MNKVRCEEEMELWRPSQQWTVTTRTLAKLAWLECWCRVRTSLVCSVFVSVAVLVNVLLDSAPPRLLTSCGKDSVRVACLVFLLWTR